jgi:putative DNA primase/helicase
MKENLTADQYKAARKQFEENQAIAYLERLERIKADKLARPKEYENLKPGQTVILPPTNLADPVLPAAAVNLAYEESLFFTDKPAVKQIYFKGTAQSKPAVIEPAWKVIEPAPAAAVLDTAPAEPDIVKHTDILKSILDQITPVNYNGIPGGQKITDSIKHLAVVYQILEITKDNDFKICQNNQSIYIFNGCYWKTHDRESFEKFLTDCCIKAGISNWIADGFQFKEHLYKQFLSTAYLSKPQINLNKVLINLQNGTFEIDKGITSSKSFDHADFLTYQLNFSFDKNATAPKWQQFLDHVLPDISCQQILAEYIGYVFIRHGAKLLKEERLLILYGTGSNGKSVIFDILKYLLGKNNISEFSLDHLTDQNGYYRAMIGDKLLNYGSDINSKIDHGIFKKIVSGEPITARLPHGSPMNFDQYAKLIFNCNVLPKDTEQTHGYYRRFLIIPFERTITDQEKDTNLAEKIAADELPGIFNWVLAGLDRLLKNNKFTYCEPAENALKSYKLDSDNVLQFLSDNDYNYKSNHFTPLADLYQSYKNHCTDSGCNPLNKRNFGNRLLAIGSKRKRLTGGTVGFNVTKNITKEQFNGGMKEQDQTEWDTFDMFSENRD